MTDTVGHAGRQRWLIEFGPGDNHLVGSEAELRDLLRDRPVTDEAVVYEVGAGPRALRKVPELARLLPQVTDSEPPIRQPHLRLETRSPERVKLSQELALLNRPLEDEVEYYDETPRSRMKPAFAAVMVLAALGGVGYLSLTQRHPADDSAAPRPVRQREQASPIGAALPTPARAAVVPTNAPAAEPVPTRELAPPIATNPTAKAEPESDPPTPSVGAAAQP